MEKGTIVEDDSIALYSRIEGEIFYKNDQEVSNQFFKGHPDLYLGDDILNAKQVDDIKSSYELDTFIPKLIDPLDKTYEAQLNVYYDLCNCPKGNLVYVLVDAPETVLNDERRRLFYAMNVISEESTEFKRAVAHLEKLLTYKDIPEEERIIKIPVPRNDELIEKMKKKAPRLREWLYEFEKKHLNLYPKDINLAV
jgi:hypothetical protein